MVFDRKGAMDVVALTASSAVTTFMMMSDEIANSSQVEQSKTPVMFCCSARTLSLVKAWSLAVMVKLYSERRLAAMALPASPNPKVQA